MRLLNAAMVNGYSIVTYQRPLQASDELDVSIVTNSSQAIIWGIGPLNDKGEVGFHTSYLKKDRLFEFGRPPAWNCPVPDVHEQPAPSQPQSQSQQHQQLQQLKDQPLQQEPLQPEQPPQRQRQQQQQQRQEQPQQRVRQQQRHQTQLQQPQVQQEQPLSDREYYRDQENNQVTIVKSLKFRNLF